MGELHELGIAALVGLAGGAVRWGLNRNRASRTRTGEVRAFPASVRFHGWGIAGRWRQGAIHQTSEGPVWRPRPPRTGRPFPLQDLRNLGRRSVHGREQIWINPGCAVLLLEGPTGPFDLAVLPTDLPAAERCFGLHLR